MRKDILLSVKRDSDLVGLYFAVGVKEFNKYIKDALRSTIRHDYVGGIHPRHNMSFELPDDIKSVKIQISLSSENDEDVRNLMKHIKKGKITAFVKSALRFYLGRCYVLGSYLDDEIKIAENIQPIQVFSLNGASGETVAIKKRRKTNNHRSNEKKYQNTVNKQIESEISKRQTEDEQKYITNIENKYESYSDYNNTNVNESTGDEVLDLLNGLLGL